MNRTIQLVITVVTLVLLVGLFFYLKPKDQTIQPFPSVTENVSSPSAQVTNTDKVFELVVKDKKLFSGPETTQVNQGDEVVIKITADEDEELHLHGYDKSVDLEKDKTAELKFKADLTGRFVYELEKSKTDIGALEVSPKY